MEARLGADFSDVRVHRDAAARRSAGGIGARAYTSGNHVVLGEGGGDQHTLAHELTHVIQQRQGPVAGTDNGTGLRVSDPGDRFEREAEENATRVMAQAPPVVEAAPGPQATTGAETPQVQWAADDEDRKDHEEYDGPRCQQVKPSKEGTRSANLRMQDRLAREAHAPNARKTPHVAVRHVPDEGLRYSSNSGQKKLSEAKRNDALASVDAAMDSATPLSDDPRRRKDQIKLRAARSGDYERAHQGDTDLGVTTKALRSSRGTWNGGLVHDKKEASVHGEMTLLGEQIAYWRKNPWPLGEGTVKDASMGASRRRVVPVGWRSTRPMPCSVRSTDTAWWRPVRTTRCSAGGRTTG
ncbi:eCIS core domain-containing protein [Streptomyces chrestomyceticus]|uniref:eCIS core domain-containing protein n=1 Tax=Streptomyces chrestomyceticus TaxID=68185 RepID=UPI003F4CC04C